MNNLLETIILELRKQGKSQKDLAQALNVTGKTMSKWLNAKQKISLADFQRACEFLNLEIVVKPQNPN